MSRKELLRAFRGGSKEKALSLLQQTRDPATITDYDWYNRTLLHWAAYRGWPDVCALLVDKYHIDTEEKNKDGCTALHLACACDHLCVVHYLVNTACSDPLVKDLWGGTPLDETSGECRVFLKEIIDDAKKNGFSNVVKYLKHRSVQLAYFEAIAEGGGKLCHCNIVLHGPPGAGKSSLKDLMLGQPPRPKHKQNATNVLEETVRTVNVERLATSSSFGGLMEVSNDELISRIAREVYQPKQQINTATSKNHNINTSMSLNTDRSSCNSTKKFLEENLSNDSARIQAEDFIKSWLLSGSSAISGHGMFDSHWIHHIDSGGQPQFLDAIPLMYRSPSHFIVVVRLTQGLDEKPKVQFFIKGEDAYFLPDYLVQTNQEMIIRICQIAQSVGRSTESKFKPRVFVVGTHLDKVAFYKRSKRLQKINEQLVPVHKMFEDVIICKSENEIIFPFNTMAKGKKRQKYTEEFQKHILSAAEKTGNPKVIPLKWLIFHLELDQSESGVVRMSECLKIGEKLKMDKTQVYATLEFLNQSALLLYYPDDVPDLVLTKMDPFTSRLSKLIKASFIPPDDGPTEESTQLREKGVFMKSFLSRVFRNEEDQSLSDDEFLQLSVSLKIAICNGEGQYVIPCTLSLKPPLNISEFVNCCIPLAFVWGQVILPHGFFVTVSVELQDKNERKGDYVFELRQDIAQWRGEMQFSEEKRRIPGVIKLADRKTWIEVSYSGDKSYCPTVYHVVNSAIKHAIVRLKHMGIGHSMVGYQCPLSCKVNQMDHYCYLSEDRQFVTCSIRESICGPVTEDMLCWFEGNYTSTPLQSISTQTTTDISSCNPSTTHVMGVVSNTDKHNTNLIFTPTNHTHYRNAHNSEFSDSKQLPLTQTFQTPKSDDQSNNDISLSIIPVDDRVLNSNSSNIVAILSKIILVNDWFTLGLILGLERYEMERIERDGYDERERLRKMVSLWLDSGNASWRCLVEALLHPLLKREDIAKRISEQYPLLK